MDYVKWAFNLHPGKMPEPTTEIWPIDGKQTYVYREHESKEPEPDKQLEELVMYGDMDHQFYDDEEEEAKRKAARKKDIRKFGKEEIYEILGVPTAVSTATIGGPVAVAFIAAADTFFDDLTLRREHRGCCAVTARRFGAARR